MNISEVAAASGYQLETIRYHGRVGLLPSPGTPAAAIVITARSDVVWLRFANRGCDLGFSLDEIRSLLHLAPGAGDIMRWD